MRFLSAVLSGKFWTAVSLINVRNQGVSDYLMAIFLQFTKSKDVKPHLVGKSVFSNKTLSSLMAQRMIAMQLGYPAFNSSFSFSFNCHHGTWVLQHSGQ